MSKLRHKDWPRGGGEIARLMRDHDWSATTLGPIDAWPSALKTAVDMMLPAATPMAIYWGRDFALLYNDRWRTLVGEKHPSALGRPARDVFPEFREALELELAAVLNGDDVIERKAQRFLLIRHGAPEEAWFDYSFNPIPLENGSIGGIFNIATETTAPQKAEHAERRSREALSESEARFRMIADQSPVIIWLAGPDGSCDFLSQSWYDLTGQTPETGLGWGWLDALHPADAAANEKTLRGGLEQREAHRLDYRVRNQDGEYRWLADTVVPRFDGDRFVGFIGSAVDVTSRKIAEDELARTSSLLDTIFETAPIGLAVWDHDLRFVRVNQRLAELNGLDPADHIDKRPDEILPDIQELAPIMQSLRDVIDTGEPLRDVEITGETPAAPGLQRSWNESFFPIRHWGEIIGLGGVVVETTRQKQTEQALRKSEMLFRSLIEGIPQLVWRATPDGRRSWSSPQWQDYTGQADSSSRGRGWLEMVHPGDRDGALEAWKGTTTITSHAEYRIFHAKEARYKWFQSRARPVIDDAGQITEWIGTSSDIDDLRQMHERQRRLLSELQHGVRNTLAVIRSIARRTAETSGTVEEYEMNFQGRIDAFARLQSMATGDPGRGIDFENIISEELLACAAHEGEQAQIDGPPLRLQPKPAETLALAVHELATNAIKFGALSDEQGRIKIVWKIESAHEPPLLQFEWKELSSHKPEAPVRRGFGSELLTRSLGYELQAKVSHIFEESGLRCTIELPLTPRIMVESPDPAG